MKISCTFWINIIPRQTPCEANSKFSQPTHTHAAWHNQDKFPPTRVSFPLFPQHLTISRFNLGNKCWLIAVSIYTCLNRAIVWVYVCVCSFVRICLTINIVSHTHTHTRSLAAWHTVNWVEQQTFGHVTSGGFSSDCARKEPPPLQFSHTNSHQHTCDRCLECELAGNSRENPHPIVFFPTWSSRKPSAPIFVLQGGIAEQTKPASRPEEVLAFGCDERVSVKNKCQVGLWVS